MQAEKQRELYNAMVSEMMLVAATVSLCIHSRTLLASQQQGWRFVV
jgi:hypothetical protein